MRFVSRALSCTSLFALASVLSLSPSRVSAATIFADNFDTVGNGTSISGRTPTTSLTGGTWIAPTSTYKGDGSGGISADINLATTAALDLGAGWLTANPGLYSLKMDFKLPTGSTTCWVALGFAKGRTSDGTIAVGDNLVGNGGMPWVLFRENGQEIVFAGPGNTNQLLQTNTGVISTGTTHTVELQLDTSATNWTLNAFVDTVQQDLNGATAGNTYSFTTSPTNPTASHFVTIGTGVNGTPSEPPAIVDNFSLTGPVPEPTTAGLAFAALALLLGKRRRHTAVP